MRERTSVLHAFALVVQMGCYVGHSVSNIDSRLQDTWLVVGAIL
jgi:hypothetical protein